MAPRRLRRADMHLEEVPLAELAGTGARAKGESHRLCIFANANMVATPQQACAYHHDSRHDGRDGGDAAHGRGVHAGRERLSGREGSGNHEQTEQHGEPFVVILFNLLDPNRIKKWPLHQSRTPLQPKKRDDWIEKPGGMPLCVTRRPGPFAPSNTNQTFLTTWRRALHSHDSMTKWRITAAMGSRHTGQL